MSTESVPPRKDIDFRAAWPPVEVVERQETRREHATMALLMVACTVAIVTAPTVPVVVGAATAFIAGDAFSNWKNHPYIRRDGGDE